MQKRPPAENLLRTVADYLQDLQDRVGDADRHQLRVAVHVLGIAERQCRFGAEVDGHEQRAFSALLGVDASLGELNRLVCREIRDGRFDDRFDELVSVVAEAVHDELRITAPNRLDT